MVKDRNIIHFLQFSIEEGINLVLMMNRFSVELYDARFNDE